MELTIVELELWIEPKKPFSDISGCLTFKFGIGGGRGGGGGGGRGGGNKGTEETFRSKSELD